MAEIVLVHGIDHEQKGARVLESVWLPAIADGLTKIGREDLASGVWDRGKAGVRDVRMAFYGDLFLSAEGEGLTRAERQEIERKNEIRDHALAIQVLANAASRSEDPGQRTVAAEELDRLRANPPESMGAAAAARSVTHALLRLRYFERAAMTVLEALKPPVRQMSRYFNETSLRRDILNRVGAHVDEKTKVVIGHSLGCVVAYEALWELADSRSRNNVDLLLTVGSPLGLPPIYNRLRRRPHGPPTGIRSWVNVVDPNDIVAADHDHTKLFPDPRRGDVARRTEMTGKPLSVDNGSAPHTGTHYLVKQVCAFHIAKALDPPPP